MRDLGTNAKDLAIVRAIIGLAEAFDLRLVVVCAMLVALSGCSGLRGDGPLRAIVSPVIPASAQEIANPLRGQYEDMQEPLFPQRNPAQKRYAAWPHSYDATIRVSWRQLQSTDPRTLSPIAPDDRKYDFSVIDNALAQAAGRGMRLTLRVYTYNSCCNADNPNDTNLAIPDWVRAIPGTSTSYLGPPTGSSTNRVTQVVPNWNDPTYRPISNSCSPRSAGGTTTTSG